MRRDFDRHCPGTSIRAAFQVGTDVEALDVLAGLPGFASQEALPTALLSAFDPCEYAVMDRRALHALRIMGEEVGRSRGLTLRCLEKVRELRDDLRATRPSTTARDIDKALYMLGELPRR